MPPPSSGISSLLLSRQAEMRRGLEGCHLSWASQVVLVVKNPPADAGDIRDIVLIPGSGRSPGGGHGNLVFLSGEHNGQRSLASYSPWGCTESDTTEATLHTYTSVLFLANWSTCPSHITQRKVLPLTIVKCCPSLETKSPYGF